MTTYHLVTLNISTPVSSSEWQCNTGKRLTSLEALAGKDKCGRERERERDFD